jgi:putative DNA primase/helicase
VASGTDSNKILKLVQNRVDQEAKDLAELKKPELDEQKHLGFLKSCLNGGEHGAALVYAGLHRDRVAKIAGTESWIKFNSHHWVNDVASEARQLVTKVANEFAKVASAEKKKGEEADEKLVKRFFSRRDWLLSCSGQLKTLDMVSSGIPNPLSIKNADIDTKPWLIPCRNGVVDLRTGKRHDGRAEDYLLRAIPHNYEGFDTPAPVWEKTLTEIFNNNQSTIDFLQRLLGYVLMGNPREHVFVVMWGIGRNGKGIIMGALFHVLGEFAQVIASEFLLDQRNPRNSAAPSPDVLALKNIRLGAASETDQGRAFSPSRMKHVSGGDTMSGRNSYDKVMTTFRPFFTLFLQTNHKPKAPASDFAFWSRCILLNFPVTFTDDPKKENERPIDRDLSCRLESEASGILSWLIRGAALYQQQGLQIPDEVRAATAEYRKHEDIVGQFIDDCCEIQNEFEERAGLLYSAFQKWYAENVNAHRNPPSVTVFGEQLTTKFEKRKDREGKYYIGLKLAPGSLV